MSRVCASRISISLSKRIDGSLLLKLLWSITYPVRALVWTDRYFDPYPARSIAMHLAKNMPLEKTGPVQYRLFTNEVNASLRANVCSKKDFWTISGKHGQKCLDTG